MDANRITKFRELHSNKETLTLINIWDAASAAVIQENGAKALATSSASLAWANGYADGSKLPPQILFAAISNILRVSKVPLTVDIEDGYSNSPNEVAKLAVKLVELGVAGINIEDGTGSTDLLTEKISAIRSMSGMPALFINARTDVYLQEPVASKQRLNESIRRLKKYIAYGADGVFVPGLTSMADIRVLSNAVEAPLNIMTSDDSANIEELTHAGVRRISAGPTPFISAYSALPKISQRLLGIDERTDLNYNTLNRLFSDSLQQ